MLAMLCGGCAAVPPADAPLLLYGEVHDNAAQHAQRLEKLRTLLDGGARPALLFEQFDRERQPEIDRAVASGMGADGVIAAAAATTGSGWNWDFYRPLVELALRHQLPIVAANVSRADARRVIAEGLAAHGFDARVPADIASAQAALIEGSHCGQIDAATARRMSSAQVARDQAMARLVQQHAARGVVLIAGNGHVRRDIGVPRWLDDALRARVQVIGQLELGDEAPAKAFDTVFTTAPQRRDDPCAAMRKPS